MAPGYSKMLHQVRGISLGNKIHLPEDHMLQELL